MSPSRGAVRRAAVEQQRQRRRLLRRIGYVALASALVAVTVWQVVVQLTKPEEPDAPSAGAGAYHVRYTVTTTIRGDRTETFRDVWVDRPWRSRVETTDAEGGQVDLTVATPTHVYFATASRVLDLGQPRPYPLSGDYRLNVALPGLVQQGLAQRTGRSVVAGEHCTTYRTGKPLGDKFTAPTSAEYADLCVARDGLLLREAWTLDGHQIRVTTATSLTRGPVPASEFTVADATPLPPEQSPELVQPFSIHTLPPVTAAYWVADDPPWGFRLADRYRAQRTGLGGAAPSVSAVDAYRRGDALVVVTQQRAGTALPDGIHLRLDGIGPAVESASTSGVTLSFVSRGVRVDLTGTATPEQLRWFAQSLHPVRP